MLQQNERADEVPAAPGSTDAQCAAAPASIAEAAVDEPPRVVTSEAADQAKEDESTAETAEMPSKDVVWRKRRERRTPRLSLRKLSRKARQWKRQRQANRAATNLLQTSRLHLPTRASPATKSPLGMLLAMRSSERAPPRLRRRTLLWIPKLQSRSQMQMQMTQRQSNSQVRRR